MAGKRGNKKRPVFINDLLCASLTSGAKEASRIAGWPIYPWQIHRALSKGKQIPGIVVKDYCKNKKLKLSQKKPPIKRMLLNYPAGEEPWNQGLPPRWV